MAKRSQSITTFTPTATADTTNLVDATYVTVVQGGSSTQRVNILEVYQGGQAGASSPTFMLLSRDTTVAVTISQSTGGTDAPLDAATAALGSVPASRRPPRANSTNCAAT